MNAADSTASRPPFYLTTAIAYPNGVPHIGHAYEYISSDALARFKRLDGFDVYFMTGTDEHGLKMQQTAAKEGIDVRELAARNSDVFEAMDKTLNISFDRFIRTTDADHEEASKAIWQKMLDNGDIYLDTYSLVLGPRRGVLHRGRDHAAGRWFTPVHRDGHPGRVDGGVHLLLQVVRIPGQAAPAVRGEP